MNSLCRGRVQRGIFAFIVIIAPFSGHPEED